MLVCAVIAEEGSSWEMVSETDLWEGGDIDGDNESDQDGYVLVRQEDIVDGIACFMAAYLLSLEQTKVFNDSLFPSLPSFCLLVIHNLLHWM